MNINILCTILVTLTLYNFVGARQPKMSRFAWGEADVPNLMSQNGLPVRQFQADLN